MRPTYRNAIVRDWLCSLCVFVMPALLQACAWLKG